MYTRFKKNDFSWKNILNTFIKWSLEFFHSKYMLEQNGNKCTHLDFNRQRPINLWIPSEHMCVSGHSIWFGGYNNKCQLQWDKGLDEIIIIIVRNWSKPWNIYLLIYSNFKVHIYIDQQQRLTAIYIFEIWTNELSALIPQICNWSVCLLVQGRGFEGLIKYPHQWSGTGRTKERLETQYKNRSWLDEWWPWPPSTSLRVSKLQSAVPILAGRSWLTMLYVRWWRWVSEGEGYDFEEVWTVNTVGFGTYNYY